MIVGTDGNNAPERIEGIDPRLYFGIVARAYTYRGREPFNPDFGLGLVDALAGDTITRAEWGRRLEASFGQLEGANLESYRIRIEGGQVVLETEISDT